MRGIPRHQLGEGEYGPRQRHSTKQLVDERIRFEVRQRIARALRDAKFVTVEVSGGVVTLGGVVSSVESKFAVESLASACPGVRRVDTRVRTKRQVRDE